MNEVNKRLIEREEQNNPIAVALIGAGQMGVEIVAQIGQMRGIEVCCICDLSLGLAKKGFEDTKKKRPIVETDDPAFATRAWAEGKYVATTDYRVATRMDQVEAVIDATGSTEMGAIVSLDSMNHGKHIVMMSVECDVTIGPILRQMSENAGVVYSLAAGDEPAAICELYRFADSLGFEVVAAGKGKNNPLNMYANPDTEKEKAAQREMSARMLAEFVDGSKTAIEMTAVSNATGLLPDVPGMHGAKSTVDTLNKVFIPEADGGVLKNRTGVVDFAIGVHPGVFLVVTTDSPRLRAGLVQRDMGPGPYYTLYRPFHLTSIEVPMTVCQAVFYGESSGHPLGRLYTECTAVSKRDIKKGETLDGIGEWCYRGSVEEARSAADKKFLPLGIAQGCVVTQDIPKDTIISYEMVDASRDSVLMDLRRLQDKLYRER